MLDEIKTSGILNEGKPIFVKVCAKCKEMFRTNARDANYCAECDEEITMQMDLMEEACCDYSNKG